MNCEQKKNTLSNYVKKGMGMELWKQMKPYQRKGVGYLEKRNGRGLLGDEPGLGKTIQVLGYLRLHPEMKALIVVPATLKWNWQGEFEKWTPERVPCILEGTKPYPIPEDATVLISNYEILQFWVDKIRVWGPDIVVADEAHYLKNGKSKRTKAFQKIIKIAGCFIALTGTPIVNAPIEFYRVLRMLEPGLFSDFWAFAQKYCKPKYNGFGWNFKGSSNEEELYQLLTKDTGIMLRRRKEDVLPELDPVTRKLILIEGNVTIPKPKDMSELEEARQECLRIKTPYVFEWIDDFKMTGNKLVVFAHHRSIIDELSKRYPGCAVIDGSVTGQKRELEKKRFQEDPTCWLLLGNLKAAGVGHTLTASHYVLFVEIPWTPAEIRQAEDRLNRIGQTEKVIAFYILVKDSIETRMMNAVDRKTEIISKVVNGEEVSEAELLSKLED